MTIKTPRDLDFIAQAKADGKHFTNAAKHVEFPVAGDNTRTAPLGGPAQDKGPRYWSEPVNPAAKGVGGTFTGKGGSKDRK